MAKQKKRRHEVKQPKKDILVEKTKVKNAEPENIKSSKQRKSFKENLIYFLENKHVPIFGRFYKTFFIFSKNKENKKIFFKNFFILLFGLIFIGICLMISILSLTGIININFSGGDEYFSAAFLALALITGIII